MTSRTKSPIIKRKLTIGAVAVQAVIVMSLSYVFSNSACAEQATTPPPGAAAGIAPGSRRNTLIISYLGALDKNAATAALSDSAHLSFSYRGCSVCKIRPDAIAIQISKTALWLPYLVRELQLRSPNTTVILDPLTIFVDDDGKLSLRSTIEVGLAPNRFFFLAYTQPNVGMHGETNGPATRARTLIAYFFQPLAPSDGKAATLSWDALKSSLAATKYRGGDVRESIWNLMFKTPPSQMDELGTPLSTLVGDQLKTDGDPGLAPQVALYRELLGDSAQNATDQVIAGMLAAEMKFREAQSNNLLAFYSVGDFHESLMKQMKAEDQAAKKRNQAQVLMLGAMVATMGAAGSAVLAADAGVLSGMQMQDQAGGDLNAAFQNLVQQQLSITTTVTLATGNITASSVTELRTAFRQMLARRTLNTNLAAPTISKRIKHK